MNLPAELRELTVADALRERVVAITTDQTLEEAARIMLDRGVTALAVIDVDSRDPGSSPSATSAGRWPPTQIPASSRWATSSPRT